MRSATWARSLAPVAYAAFIFWLSSQSMPAVLGPLSLNDKVKHMALYAVFAFLVYQALAPLLSHRPRLLLAATVVLVSLYGASDELHQSFVPGRSCDVLDWVADTAAAALVAGAVFVFRRPLTAEP